MMFYAVAVALCASRSPTDTAVAFAWLSIPCKIVTVFGWYFKKKTVYILAQAFDSMIIVVLFCIPLFFKEETDEETV